MILASEKQQLNIIKDQAIRKLLIVDLDLNGSSVNSDEDFLKIGYSAVKNKILFWLESSPGDVVRSTFSSPLIQLLGKPMNQETANKYRDYIKDEFETTFSPENIFLTHIDLSINPINRTWILKMTVMDNVTDSLIDLNLEIF